MKHTMSMWGKGVKLVALSFAYAITAGFVTLLLPSLFFIKIIPYFYLLASGIILLAAGIIMLAISGKSFSKTLKKAGLSLKVFIPLYKTRYIQLPQKINN